MNKNTVSTTKRTILSVIVPVYNTPKSFLTECLDSLHRQDYSEVEFIIVNDGATDPWIEGSILDFCQKDYRFQYIKKENSGPGATRNIGMEISQGKYFMFVDSDDILLEGACKYAVNSIESTKSDVVLLGLRFTPGKQLHPIKKILTVEEITKLKYDTLAFSANYRDIDLVVDSACAKVFRKDIIMDNHIRFTDLRRSEDAMFCLHYYEHCSSICFDNKIIYLYQVNPESITHKFSDNSVKALPPVLEEMENFVYQDMSHQVQYANTLPERTAKGVAEGLNNYFLNRQNKKEINVLAKELKSFITTPIVNKFFKNSHSPDNQGRKFKFYWVLLRFGLYRSIFIFDRIFLIFGDKVLLRKKCA